MDDGERSNLVRKATRVANLSRNDVVELKKILSTGLRPWAQDIRSILTNAHRDDDAVLLKAALQGEGGLSNNERVRLKDALEKRGKRIPG